MDLDVLAPLMDLTGIEIPAPLMSLLQDKQLQERVEETARIFFSNQTITVNLIPALIVLGLIGLFIKAKGAALLFGSGGEESGGGTGYGATGYGAPSTGYGNPSAGYGASVASSGYDAPSTGYEASSGGGHGGEHGGGHGGGSTGHGSGSAVSVSSGYSAGRKRRSVFLTDSQRSLYTEQISPNLPSDHVSDNTVSHHQAQQPLGGASSVPLLS